MTVEIAEIEQVLGSVAHAETVVVAPGPQVPARWRPIAESDDPLTRRLTAVSLWNSDFLELVPDFAAALESELADVRVARVGGEAVLIYAFEHYDAAGDRYVVCWIGWDPALFTDTAAPLFGAIPEPVQRFYREVHAGFTGPDWESYGPRQPRHLQTFAEYVYYPQVLPNWPQGELNSTRLLVVASTGGNVHLCISPDLPPGQAVTVYDGVADPPDDFSHLLDSTMTEYFTDPD